MNILFDEEEVIIEEETQEETYDIPKIRPLSERRVGAATEKLVEPVPVQKTPPVVTQVVTEPEVVVTPISVEKPKTRMIDADGPKAKVDPAKELYFPKKDTKTPYQPVEIISPIFGGPKREPQALQPVVVSVSKKRESMTQVISPMYGQVETKSSLGGIEAAILDLDVEDMHTGHDGGVEIQASLYDMIEGLEDEE